MTTKAQFELNLLARQLFEQQIQRDLLYRCSVLGYQYGQMQKCLVYLLYYEDQAYKIEAKIALADLMAQAHLMCRALGFEPEDVLQLGTDRLREFVDTRMRR